MILTRWLTALLLCVASGVACAATYSNGLLALDIPDGFEGPVQESPSPEASLVGYVKRAPGDEAGTLLQISVYEFSQASGQKPDEMPEDRRIAATDRYLAQFLGGVEKQRKAFVRSPVTHLQLGGLPASRIHWSGIADGKPMSGTMYCVLLGSRVVSFHTQAPKDAPKENLLEARRAIEAVKFNK